MKQQAFINKAENTHNNFYDYSVTEYLSSRSNIKIICPIHGVFEQRATNHLSGRGCRKCATIKVSNIRRTSLNDFITSANKIHSNRYDYRNTKYESVHIPISIICPDHGEFFQAPSNHLSGKGCRKCTKYGFNIYDDSYLYILKSLNNNIIKIGITNNPNRRHSELKRKTPFDFEVIHCFKMEGTAAQAIELHIKKLSKSANLSGFDGATEWLVNSDNLINDIKLLCTGVI